MLMSNPIKFKYNSGDSISGESIIGSAGSAFEKYPTKKNGIVLKTFEFNLSAECYINLPVTNKKTTSQINVEVEGLRGTKIYGESEDCSKFKKVNLTHSHTQWQTVLKRLAYCCINVPIHSRRNI